MEEFAWVVAVNGAGNCTFTPYHNTNHTDALMLLEACEIAKGVKVIEPLQGAHGACAPPGVTVAPMVADPVKGDFNAKAYVDNMIIIVRWRHAPMAKSRENWSQLHRLSVTIVER